MRLGGMFPGQKHSSRMNLVSRARERRNRRSCLLCRSHEGVPAIADKQKGVPKKN